MRQIIRSNSPYFDLVYRAPPHLPLPTCNEALLPSIEYGKILELFLVFAGFTPGENFTFCVHQNVFAIMVERLPSYTSSVQLPSLQT